eukprot:5400654-Pyramimonas_sp.AAC.1
MRQPPQSAAIRGPTGSSTEGPSGTAHMRQPPPSTALRGPVGSSSEGHRPHASATPSTALRRP